MQSDTALWWTSEHLKDRHPVIDKKFEPIPYTEVSNAYGLKEIPRLVECIKANRANPASLLEALEVLKGEVGSQLKKVVATQCHAVESCFVLLDKETEYPIQVAALKVLAPLVLCKEGRVVLGGESYLRKLFDYLESSDSAILGLGIQVLECLTLDRIGGELFLPMLEDFRRLFTKLLDSSQSLKLQAICVLKNVAIINEGVQRMIEAGIVDQMVQVLPVLTKSYSTAMSLPVEESRATSKAASTEQGAGPDQTRETFIFLQNLSLFLSKICQEPVGRERVFNGGGLELLSCIILSWKVSEALTAFMPITLIVEAKLRTAQAIGHILVENIASPNQTVASNSLVCIQNVNEDPKAKALLEKLIPDDLRKKYSAAIKS